VALIKFSLLITYTSATEDTPTPCQHVHFSCTKSHFKNSFINPCLFRYILWFFCFSVFTDFCVFFLLPCLLHCCIL